FPPAAEAEGRPWAGGSGRPLGGGGIDDIGLPITRGRRTGQGAQGPYGNGHGGRRVVVSGAFVGDARNVHESSCRSRRPCGRSLPRSLVRDREPRGDARKAVEGGGRSSGQARAKGGYRARASQAQVGRGGADQGGARRASPCRAECVRGGACGGR